MIGVPSLFSLVSSSAVEGSATHIRQPLSIYSVATMWKGRASPLPGLVVSTQFPPGSSTTMSGNTYMKGSGEGNLVKLSLVYYSAGCRSTPRVWTHSGCQRGWMTCPRHGEKEHPLALSKTVFSRSLPGLSPPYIPAKRCARCERFVTTSSRFLFAGPGLHPSIHDVKYW